MLRRRGPNGFSVRLIDPNPTVGFSHPLYDVGKLLHWTESVGWIKYGRDLKKKSCNASWRTGPGGWRLNARITPLSEAAERRRIFVEEKVRHFAGTYRKDYGPRFDAMLALSTASAHVGLAALYRAPDANAERRAVIAGTLSHLTKLAHANN
jgi:hypothetical protein